ncbi:MAG TPA: class I SAM-dependent methyltransferase [Kofleriaceae bacterium]|nr:class I SAM-dependent methyltransferase [Kofleriaceae bacterium]
MTTTDRREFYRATFDRFVANTDGKEKLAQEIAAIARSMKAARLLDLGAGNGVLTRLVSPHFQTIVAVEQNRAFEASLALIPNAVPVISRIEDYVPVEPPDIVLMSYSLDGIPGERLGATMTTLASHLAPGGKVLFVTYEDDCPWDRYIDPVYRALGIPRTGGARRHLEDLQRAGFEARRLASVDGFIWAQDKAALYDVLGFFFIDAIDGYHASRPELEDLLAGIIETLPDGRVALRAVECVFEIVV